MGKIEGGHAIMLAVEPNEDMVTAGCRWCQLGGGSLERPRLMKLGWHLTLTFVGRDMEDIIGEQMIFAAKQALPVLPAQVTFGGHWAMFGGKKDHLVGVLEMSDGLSMSKNVVEGALIGQGLKIRNDFGGFKPHLTIATGPGPALQSWDEPRVLVVRGLEVKIGSERKEFFER